MSDNMLFLVSGPSGSGKTTVMRKVMNNEVVSFTTRAPRQGEVEGVDYHFMTLEEFQKLKAADRLIEYTEYGGNFYGISKDEIETKLAAGPAYAIVDYEGMRQLSKLYPDNLKLFIYCSKKEARFRMELRGDTAAKIESRLQTFWEELQNSHHYNFVIQNRNYHLEATIELVKGIVFGNKPAGRVITESQAYGNDCPSGRCEG